MTSKECIREQRRSKQRNNGINRFRNQKDGIVNEWMWTRISTRRRMAHLPFAASAPRPEPSKLTETKGTGQPLREKKMQSRPHTRPKRENQEWTARSIVISLEKKKKRNFFWPKQGA